MIEKLSNSLGVNFVARFKNKVFWVTIVPMIFVLIHQLLKLFGIDFAYEMISEEIVNIIETVFAILGVCGIVADPTTAGMTDSRQAMLYTEPKKDK